MCLCESKLDQQQTLSVAPLIPVFFTAIFLFLAINGPSDWAHLWNQVVNPPANSRHALRKGEGKRDTKIAQQKLKEYALGVEKSLKASVQDEKSRLGMVERIFGDLKLNEKMAKEIADIFKGLKIANAKEHFQKLQIYADKNLKHKKELHAKFVERSAKFVENLIQVWKQK